QRRSEHWRRVDRRRADFPRGISDADPAHGDLVALGGAACRFRAFPTAPAPIQLHDVDGALWHRRMVRDSAIWRAAMGTISSRASADPGALAAELAGGSRRDVVGVPGVRGLVVVAIPRRAG